MPLLKALLILRGGDPPKLHDIDRLTARLSETDARLFEDVGKPSFRLDDLLLLKESLLLRYLFSLAGDLPPRLRNDPPR